MSRPDKNGELINAARALLRTLDPGKTGHVWVAIKPRTILVYAAPEFAGDVPREFEGFRVVFKPNCNHQGEERSEP